MTIANNAPLVLFDHLPKIHQEIYTLRAEGFKYADIAAKLRIPIGTVRSRLHRARANLALLDSLYGGASRV